MTRDEHIKWCKERAIEEMNFYPDKPWQGVVSMMSDLGKHPETVNHPGIMMGASMMLIGKLKTRQQVADFIKGFN